MPTPPAFVSTREHRPEDDPPAKPHNEAGSDEDDSTELSSNNAPGANQCDSPSNNGTSATEDNSGSNTTSKGEDDSGSNVTSKGEDDSGSNTASKGEDDNGVTRIWDAILLLYCLLSIT